MGMVDLTKPQQREWVKDLLENIKAREFVAVEDDRVVVAVDSEKVDDIAIDRALEMLETIDDFSVGTSYEFGSYKQFDYREVDEPPTIV